MGTVRCDGETQAVGAVTVWGVVTGADRQRGRRRLECPGAALLAAVFTACGGDPPSVLDPSSDAGERVAGLW